MKRIVPPLVAPLALGYLIYLALFLFPTQAASQKYAVVVGHNIGHLSDDPLRYAERDAERFWELLTSIGEVKRQNSFLLLGPSKRQILATLGHLSARLSSEARSGQAATVIFYYAGHGDQQDLHLAKESLRRDTLIQRLESLDARLKLVILDACQTPRVAQRRGVRGAPSFAVTISSTSAPKGVVIIQSSQAGAPALESDALGGSLFSHYWLSALRGAADSDRDGVVSLQEAYLFTSRRTFLYSSGSSDAVQQPSFRIDLEGSHDVVLTRLSEASAKVVIVDDKEATYLIFRQSSGAFVAEAHPVPKLPLEVAVPSGRLLVHRRAGGDLQVAQMEMAMGGSHFLTPSDFLDRPYEQVARRGGSLSLYPHRMATRYAVRGDYLRGVWIVRHGPGLEYEYEIDHWSLRSELAVFFSSHEHGLFSSDEVVIGTLLGAHWLYPLDAVLLNVGFGPSIQWIYQKRRRSDADRLATVGLDSESISETWTISPGIHADVGWTASVSEAFFISNGLRGSLFALRLRDGADHSWYAAWTLEGAVGIGCRF